MSKLEAVALEEAFESAAVPVEQSDTDGIPDETTDLAAEADGALATDETEEESADTDDGTPDEDSEDVGGFEKRFKDTQAELTEKSQALAEKQQEFDDFKDSYAQQIDQITAQEERAQDWLAETEQVAASLLGPIQARLQQLGQVNAQGLTQEQYSMWQTEVNQLQGQAHHFGQVAEQAKQRVAAAKKQADTRQREHDDKVLSVLIPDFDEVKGEIAQYALSRGWPKSTVYSLNDPHILQLLNERRQMDITPDTIEEVSRKKPAKRRAAQAKPVQRNQPKSLAEKLYGEK